MASGSSSANLGKILHYPLPIVYFCCCCLLFQNTKVLAVEGDDIDSTFLSPFKNCLIHLVNYQSLDLDWLDVPVVLEEYYIAKKYDELWGVWDKVVIHYNISVAGGSSAHYIPAKLSRIPFNWNCLLHVYLFPQRKGSRYQSDLFGERLILPSQIEGFFLSPLMVLGGGYTVDVQRSVEVFHLLVTPPTISRNFVEINKWLLGVSLTTGVPFNRMAITVNPSFEAVEVYLICQFCKNYEYTLVEFDVESTPYDLPSLKFGWKDLNGINVGVPWLIKDCDRPDADNFVSSISNLSLEVKFGFRGLSTETDLNHVLFTFAVTNGSAWKEPYLAKDSDYHHRYGFTPKIQFNERENGRFFTLREESIKFLTCDGAITETLSFMGFISAFDKPSWLAGLLLWSLTAATYLLIYFVNRRSSSASERRQQQQRMPVYESIENVGRILLEQGDILLEKYPGEIPILIVSLSWVLMGMILSNAYKGNNIKELSAPRGLQLVHRFDQLYENNFTLYMYPSRKMDGIYRGTRLSDMKIPTDQKAGLKHAYGDIAGWSFGADHSIIGDELEDIVIGLGRRRAFYKKNGSAVQLLTVQREIDKFVDLYNHVIRIPWEYSNGSNLSPFDMALRCDRNAYGDWTSRIQLSKLKMEKLKPNRQVVESTEGIVPMKIGWNMQTWFDGGILWRMAALVESGIVDEWKLFHLRLQKMRIRKLAKEEVSEDEPIIIALEHNVSTVFYLFLCCVFVCLVVFGLEKLMGWAAYFTFRARRIIGILDRIRMFSNDREMV
jgi:hypothetical protein